MPEVESSIRPTKKQRELLDYIAAFIAEHGYSPSYREIMSGVGYNSVATVALHVNNLIARGHIKKRDKSARSLEIIKNNETPALQTNEIKPNQEKWLVEKVEYRFSSAEQERTVSQSALDELYVLIGALKVLGLEGAVQSFMPRLSDLKKKTQ